VVSSVIDPESKQIFDERSLKEKNKRKEFRKIMKERFDPRTHQRIEHISAEELVKSIKGKEARKNKTISQDQQEERNDKKLIEEMKNIELASRGKGPLAPSKRPNEVKTTDEVKEKKNSEPKVQVKELICLPNQPQLTQKEVVCRNSRNFITFK
jgi:hypothetical protein